MDDPTRRWVAYGFVIDTDDDGVDERALPNSTRPDQASAAASETRWLWPPASTYGIGCTETQRPSQAMRIRG